VVAQPVVPVIAASPPKDDGGSAKGGAAGADHSAALEQLAIAQALARVDKQRSISVLLPDAAHWTRVRFLTVQSLVAFRYGKEHHAIVGGFVTHVDDNSVQNACSKAFEQWASPWIEAFGVDIDHEPPEAIVWPPKGVARRAPATLPAAVNIVDIDPLRAKTATVLLRESYEAAWAAYPVWGKTACLAIGVAVPIRGDDARARKVRDRFVKEVLPRVEVLTAEEPKERY